MTRRVKKPKLTPEEKQREYARLAAKAAIESHRRDDAAGVGFSLMVEREAIDELREMVPEADLRRPADEK